MDIKDINKTSIKAYLADKGITPVKDRGYYGMYHSPFRDDNNASVKVDYNKNLWIDFGSNEGGTFIDLVMRINNCSFTQAIEKVHTYVSTHVSTTVQQPDSFSFHGNKNSSAITINEILPITHKALTDYLSVRMIDIDVAKRYCKEVHYSVNNKPFFAIGFQNDNEGWVLRSEPFKGCTSMDIKTFTDPSNKKDTCLIFEGFMDYLSYLTIKNIQKAEQDVIVLNSVVNLPKAINLLKNYKEVHTYLDNDDSGKNATLQINKWSSTQNRVHIDKSTTFANHKDLNDYLVSTRQKQNNEQKQAHQRKPSQRFRM